MTTGGEGRVPADVSAGIERQAAAGRAAARAVAGSDLTIVALDVDGTQSPVTDDAENAGLAPEFLPALAALADNPRTALVRISGRPAAFIRRQDERHGIAHLTLPILGTYGRVTWLPGPDGRMVDGQHEAVATADARLEILLPVLQEEIARRMPEGSNLEFDTDTTRHDDPDPPMFFERKPGMLTFAYGHGGGRREVLQAALSCDRVRSLMHELDLHTDGPEASGNVEIDGLPQGTIDKGIALTRYVHERRERLQAAGIATPQISLIAAGDDGGDRAMRDAVFDLLADGTVTTGLWLAVYTPARGTREGTPADLYDGRAAAVFLSPAEFGRWLQGVAGPGPGMLRRPPERPVARRGSHPAEAPPKRPALG